jgi:HK97 family phage major capsid protein
VGAFKQAATVYRKGGVRVESTNSHASDFTSNLVTVRAEERVALAVRRPFGFVKVTLNYT